MIVDRYSSSRQIYQKHLELTFYSNKNMVARSIKMKTETLRINLSQISCVSDKRSKAVHKYR